MKKREADLQGFKQLGQLPCLWRKYWSLISDNISVLSDTPNSCSRISTVGYGDKYIEAGASKFRTMFKIGGDNDDSDGDNYGGQRKL